MGVTPKSKIATQRNRNGEGEDVPAQTQTLQIGHARHHELGNQPSEHLHCAEGKSEPKSTAQQDEDKAFGDKLASEAAARSSKRSANADFLTPAFGAHQQQAGDVYAGNDQQQAGTGQQRQ